MTMNLFSYIICCGIYICMPAAIANSQRRYVNGEQEKTVYNKKLSYAEKVKKLHEKEAENKNLKVKVKANEHEINELLVQLIEKKSEVKREPIYKRIFPHRNKKKVLPGIITEPIPVKIDTALEINKVDSVTVIVPVVPKGEAFFKRLFHKVFKHKNKIK